MTRRQNAAFGVAAGSQVVMLAVNLTAHSVIVIVTTAICLITVMTIAALWARSA